MKQLRSVLSLILVLIMLTAAACLSAAAIGSPPTNLYWSSGTACWSAPSESGLTGYTVTLYKGGEIGAYTVTSTTYDFNSLMQSSGSGEYQFSVRAEYSGGGFSETVYSGYYDYTAAHTHSLKHIDFKYPTCTEKGMKEHYECSSCGRWYWDSDANYEITDHSEVVLDPYGHNWGDWEVVKHATKTEKGQERRVCAEDPDHVEYRDIPALGEDEPESTAETETKKETKATEPTAPTKATTAPTEITTTGTSALSKLLGNMLIWIIVAVVALILIIAAVVIVLVVVLKKRKTPPTNPPTYPADPSQQPPYAQPTQYAQPTDPTQYAQPTEPTPYAQPVQPPTPPTQYFVQPSEHEQPTQTFTPPKAQDDFDDHFNDMP